MSALTFPIRGRLLSMTVECREHLAHVVSPFQTIDVYDTEVFGRILLLDGHIQLAELDEVAYHECLVRLPLLNLPSATRVAIIGGGDGGALREACRFDHLEHIDLIEIDGAVIETSRSHLPGVSDKAFDDPRVTVHVGDAFPFMKGVREEYDLIVLDSTDTYEGSEGDLSDALFTEEFYADCRRALKPGGVVVTQADNPVFCPYSLAEVRVQLAKVFNRVGDYFGLVPSFGGYSAFCYASCGELFSERWDKAWPQSRYLNQTSYELALNPPKF